MAVSLVFEAQHFGFSQLTMQRWCRSSWRLNASFRRGLPNAKLGLVGLQKKMDAFRTSGKVRAHNQSELDLDVGAKSPKYRLFWGRSQEPSVSLKKVASYSEKHHLKVARIFTDPVKMAEKKGPGIWAMDMSTFQENYLKLFESGKLDDVKVKCADYTWKLHKAILCARSKWFKSALAGSYRGTGTGEVIEEDFEKLDLEPFLKFLYTGSFDIQKSYPGVDAFVALMRVWKTADYFCHDELCDLAVCAAKDHAQELARTFCSAFPAIGHGDKVESLLESSFNPAVRTLYDEANESLKSSFLPILLELALASTHRLSQSNAFQSLLHDTPGFAVDWTTSLMKSFSTWSAVSRKRAGGQCNECGRELGGGGTVDTLKWVRHVRLMVLCDRCYQMPSLAEWENRKEIEENGRCKKRKLDLCAGDSCQAGDGDAAWAERALFLTRQFYFEGLFGLSNSGTAMCRGQFMQRWKGAAFLRFHEMTA
ncbi:btb poz domain-containing protein [Diaporthe amygdali]|uniref:btb poz domain-containing protein n=1 Tax=Phomopsis amygdali TaxID=1214568 RepID=UPI0022FDC3EA|nr:btb poz domain-containing protein [Diaporthe amygdali]KAJ0116889.1 btb poz domain-containing protein [Diaporthe amygdali]